MNRLRLIFGVLALLSVGCKRHRAAQETPPLPVETVQAIGDNIPHRMRFIGTLASQFDAVVQPRVNGYLLSIDYESGTTVRKGQLLFTIDPAQLSTSMLEAQASLESARAQLAEARNNYERAVPLAEIDAISAAQLDQYTATYKAAEATVRSTEQALRSAEMNVGYTELRSPIDGIAAHTAAHAGDYVGPNTQFDVLTTVSNIDTLTVDVAIPMAEYLKAAGRDTPVYDNGKLLSDIRLTLSDGTVYPYAGRYAYTRKDIASTTGTLVLVVSFPNPGQRLKPGEFARVDASVGPSRQVIVVPSRCVNQTQDVNSVWVIRPDSTVAYRRVTTGDTYGENWCIEEGLAAGEWVVLSGSQKLRNGTKVAPKKP
ncbi:MAG: efflux RND transporter periplasmic adaptor subunit [Alistipes sp.]|nr:efflux RND transporter periplasmic adaptor subunit [Alistipes sp.]